MTARDDAFNDAFGECVIGSGLFDDSTEPRKLAKDFFIALSKRYDRDLGDECSLHFWLNCEVDRADGRTHFFALRVKGEGYIDPREGLSRSEKEMQEFRDYRDANKLISEVLKKMRDFVSERV